jgi:hypothetical protein
MFLLKRMPTRRLELLFSLAVVLGMFGLVGVLQRSYAGELAYWLVLLILELILPIAIGTVAAGLLAGDPALDILLSAHRPGWQALVERMLFLGGVGILLGSTVLILAANWGIVLPKLGSDQIYIWLSPMVFCMGLSSAGALVRGRMLDGILLTIGVMGGSLIALTMIPRACAGNAPGEACAMWLLSPVMTLGNAGGAFWPLNRLLWLGLGASLIILSISLSKREEAILQEVASE